MRLTLGLLILLSGGLAGCGFGSEPVKPDQSAAPECHTVWAEGKTLPDPYVGCRLMKQFIGPEVLRDCSKDGGLVTYKYESEHEGSYGFLAAEAGEKVRFFPTTDDEGTIHSYSFSC